MSTHSTIEYVMNPRLPWNDTGVNLEQGKRYRITVQTDTGSQGLYADQSVECTPDGPVGFKGWLLDTFARNAEFPLNPVHWLDIGKIKHLRVLRDRDGSRASFLTVVGCIGRDDSEANTFIIGRGREIVAHATGELVVFSNDWPGGAGEGSARFDNSKTYNNNKGVLRLLIETL
jgi:hypothetical protein